MQSLIAGSYRTFCQMAFFARENTDGEQCGFHPHQYRYVAWRKDGTQQQRELAACSRCASTGDTAILPTSDTISFHSFTSIFLS